MIRDHASVRSFAARIEGEILPSNTTVNWNNLPHLNKGYILHRLDDLTGIIWVILSKKYILQRLLLRTDVIYSFLPYFEARTTHSHTISFCYVITMSAASNMCYYERLSIYQDSTINYVLFDI